MQNPLRDSAFWNGLRMMITMLIPITIGVMLGYSSYAFMLGLGALLMGISDIPGTNAHRRNGMLISLIIMVICHAIIAFANLYPPIRPFLLVLLAFLLSYIALYGMRASIIGSGAMLAMIFALFAEANLTAAIMSPLMIASGALLYFVISFTFMQFRPYRIVKQMMGESIQDIGAYIRIRAGLYDINTDNKQLSKVLMKQQIHINEQQEHIRELLWKNRRVKKGTGHYERALAMIFSESVNILELGMASHFDYALLKSQYKNSDILNHFHQTILSLGSELSHIGKCIAEDKRIQLKFQVEEGIELIRSELDAMSSTSASANTAKDLSLLINAYEHIKTIYRKCIMLMRYYNRENKTYARNFKELRLDLFTQHETYTINPFFTNLSLKSIHFRHALRTAIVFAAGISVGYLFPHQKSYWILLTIAIILRANFSLTIKKANQRVIGTIIGALIGLGLVSLPFFNNTIGIIILILAAWGSFTFNVLNYRTSVIFTTILALLGNYFLIPDFFSLFGQRIIDTLIGAGLSLGGLYFLWPDWEAKTIADKLIKVLEANKKYISSIGNILSATGEFKVSYKLARKDSLLANSDLSAAFQRMLNNPSKAQFQPARVYSFSTLNYAFMHHTATLASQLIDSDNTHLKSIEAWLCTIANIESVLEQAAEIIRRRYQDTDIDSGDIEPSTSSMDIIHSQESRIIGTEEDKAITTGTSSREHDLSVDITTYLSDKDTNVINYQLEHLQNLASRILKQSREFGTKLKSQGL